jgi:hypothetical protein
MVVGRKATSSRSVQTSHLGADRALEDEVETTTTTTATTTTTTATTTTTTIRGESLMES